MIVGRIIGWLLLAIAAGVAATDLLIVVFAGEVAAAAFGQSWFDFDRDSLGLSQAVIQRYVWPYFWHPIITTALLWPTWLSLCVVAAIPGVVGLFLAALCRGDSRRGRLGS